MRKTDTKTDTDWLGGGGGGGGGGGAVPRTSVCSVNKQRHKSSIWGTFARPSYLIVGRSLVQRLWCLFKPTI